MLIIILVSFLTMFGMTKSEVKQLIHQCAIETDSLVFQGRDKIYFQKMKEIKNQLLKESGNMAKELKPKIGDKITVMLNSGKEFTGTYDIHILAGYCVLNDFGFPLNYKRIIKVWE